MQRKIQLLILLAAACSADSAAPDATVQLGALGSSGVAGTVEFTLVGEGEVRIDADITGLAPGKHGMHVHEFGDCSSADGMSAGGHFNPDTVDHGAPGSATHHPGDFGNLEADSSGHAVFSLTTDTATFSIAEGDKYNILGRAVIVHEKLDDYGQPTGNAGGRLACGVVNAAGGTSPPVKNPGDVMRGAVNPGPGS